MVYYNIQKIYIYIYIYIHSQMGLVTNGVGHKWGWSQNGVGHKWGWSQMGLVTNGVGIKPIIQVFLSLSHEPNTEERKYGVDSNSHWKHGLNASIVQQILCLL